MMEASHFDFNEAYAAVDRHQLDDFTPHIYRTRDLGKSWQDIARGLPREGYVHFVKEDPKRRGLLFAGTERGVFISFDDGDNWQSLQLNLPVTSVRDIEIHGDDAVLATHGRGFWVLDDRNHGEYLDLDPSFGHRGDEIDVYVSCDDSVGRLESDVLDDIEVSRYDGHGWRYRATTHVEDDADSGEHTVRIRCGDDTLEESFFVQGDGDSPGGGDQVTVYPKGAPETGGERR